MTAQSKSSAFPDTVQPGIPQLPPHPPNGWSRTPLKSDLYEEKRPVKMRDDEEYDLVTVKRGRGGVVKRERKRGADISVKTQFEVKAGDFLISKRQIVHGACGLVPPQLEGSTVSNEYAVLRSRGAIDLDFLKYLSHSIYFQQTCFHSSIGVHIEKMIFKTDKWLDWEFDLPPLSEQRRIAELLGTWDRAIEATEKLIRNSQSQKKALMQKLLNRRIRLRGFKGKWRDVRLAEMANIYAGGTPSTKEPDYWGGDIPWMSSGEVNLREVWSVQGRITRKGFDSSSTRTVPANSVLIALAGQGKTRGKVAINRIELCTNQSLAAIVPHKGYSCDYLFHNLDSRYEELRSLSLGDGGRGGLNLSIIGGITIPVPGEAEQEAIANVLSAADREISLLQKKSKAFSDEAASLMQQVLFGKRRLYSANANEEAA